MTDVTKEYFGYAQFQYQETVESPDSRLSFDSDPEEYIPLRAVSLPTKPTKMKTSELLKKRHYSIVRIHPFCLFVLSPWVFRSLEYCCITFIVIIHSEA